MHDTPLISIITVCFNAERYIDKTMKSVKEQSFPDYEHVVVDGASTDSTLKIIKDEASPNMILSSEPDKGLYDAMNKGLEISHGKYVIFLNAGDTFHDSHTLSAYASKAKDNADIIYGDTIIVNYEGKKIGKRHLSVPDTLDRNSFSNGMLICHQAFMVKKSIVPSYDLSYHFSSDYDWCVKCISESNPARCFNLNLVTVDYLNDGITDKNKIKSLKERFRIMRKHYGLTKTIIKHAGFFIRAAKRGKL